ncbi:alpha/beta fold hydrolase [Aeromicrobium sp. CF4.19]|uniref:alpha/beta fold hydrolase n=1 Tax=Aeromicrobium sp. CF4.19 TaxID=3373082 RepID=UPI003EE641D3
MTDLQHRRLADHDVTFVDVPSTADEPGVPLVLLHGGASDHRAWRPQLEAFPERRVIAPDARGHGGSSDASQPYRLADDVVALLDALDVASAVLAGVSMGGGTSVDVALEHPDRCAGIVVSGTGASEPVFTEPWAIQAFADWAAAEAAGDAERWLEVFMRFTHGPHRRPEEVDSEVTALVHRMALETLTEHVRPDEHGAPVPPTRPTPVAQTWERVAGLAVPLLVLNGTLDGDDHLANGRRLVDLVDGAAYVELPGAAHYPNLEQAEAYDATVRTFLGRHGL